MKHRWKNLITAVLLVLVLSLLGGVSCLAESGDPAAPQPVENWTFDENEALLRIELDNVQKLKRPAAAPEYAQKVLTIWISGNVETIDKKAFYDFPNAEYLILDTPDLILVESNAFSNCKKLAHVFYVGETDGDLAAPIGMTTARHIYLKDTDELCRVKIGECEHGTIVTTAARYEKKGTQVLVSVLPGVVTENGIKIAYRQGTIQGLTMLSEHVASIEDNETTITASTWTDWREIRSSGNSGASIRWVLFSDGELLISGVGEIPATSTAKYPWYSQRDAVRSVTVDGGITKIPANAFSLPAARTATFGENVTALDSNAFSACKAMYQAEFLGDYPTEIKDGIFPYSEAGRFLVVWHEGRSGWNGSFVDNGGAGTAYPTTCAEGKVEDFSELTLSGGQYRNDQDVIFTLDSVTKTAYVGTNSERGNNSGYYGLNGGNVVIPDVVTYNGQSYTVTLVSRNAFSGNLVVRTVALGANVRDVTNGAFYGCENFTAFTVDEKSGSFKELDGILYSSQMNMLCIVPGGAQFQTYEVPSCVSRIDTGAFYGCIGIDKVELNLGVKIIGDYAFANAGGIREIWINGDVEIIGDYAFNDCTGLTTLHVYDGLAQMGTTPFKGCTSLRALRLPFLGYSVSSPQKLTTLFGVSKGDKVPAVSVRLSSGTLVKSAFAGCNRLQEVSLPRSITTIPVSCFDGCTALTDLSCGYNDEDADIGIGKQITAIGDYAFRNCPRISRFSVQEGNEHYTTDFWGALYTAGYKTLICFPPASELQYYCVKGSTESVKAHAFYNCSRLVSINVPNPKTDFLTNSVYPSPLHDNVMSFPMRICVHRDSKAEVNLGTTRVWIIEDNYPTAIRIQRLSDRVAFEAGSAEFSNLYFVAVYPSVTILLDEMDYDLEVSSTDPGPRDVKATYHQKNAEDKDLSVTFHVRFFQPEEGRQILEYPVESSLTELAEPRALAAFYKFSGRMADVTEAYLINNVNDPVCNDMRVAVYVRSDMLGGNSAQLKVFLADNLAAARDPILEAWLPAPRNLTWGVLNSNGIARNRPGEIGIGSAGESGDFGSYSIEVYLQKADCAELVLNAGAVRDENGIAQTDSFVRKIEELGSGDYYFEAVASGNQSRQDSKAIRSDVFSYVKPETTLEPCTELSWSTDGNALNWTRPENTEHIGGYTIRVYYRRWTSGPWRAVGSQYFFFDEQYFCFDEGKANLNSDFRGIGKTFFSWNEDRPGYYAFTVTNDPDDVTAANRSVESEMSDFYYYRGRVVND